MREARDLLKCERCAVYLLDLESCSEEVSRKKNKNKNKTHQGTFDYGEPT